MDDAGCRVYLLVSRLLCCSGGHFLRTGRTRFPGPLALATLVRFRCLLERLFFTSIRLGAGYVRAFTSVASLVHVLLSPLVRIVID